MEKSIYLSGKEINKYVSALVRFWEIIPNHMIFDRNMIINIAKR